MSQEGWEAHSALETRNLSRETHFGPSPMLTSLLLRITYVRLPTRKTPRCAYPSTESSEAVHRIPTPCTNKWIPHRTWDTESEIWRFFQLAIVDERCAGQNIRLARKRGQKERLLYIIRVYLNHQHARTYGVVVASNFVINPSFLAHPNTPIPRDQDKPCPYLRRSTHSDLGFLPVSE